MNKFSYFATCKLVQSSSSQTINIIITKMIKQRETNLVQVISGLAR